MCVCELSLYVCVWLTACLCQGLCLCLDSYGACRPKWALRGQLRSPARDHRLACSLQTLPFSPAQSCDYCKRGGAEMSQGGCAGKHRQLFKAWEGSPDCSGLTNALYVGQWSTQRTYRHSHTCSPRLNEWQPCSLCNTVTNLLWFCLWIMIKSICTVSHAI